MAIKIFGRHRRLVFLLASLLWTVVIFLFSTIPGSGLPSNLGFWSNAGHFFEYLVLGGLLALTLHHPRRTLWKTAVFAIAIASLYGASDEFHQLFVDGRCCDVWDWVTDTLGASVGVLGAAGAILAWRHRK